MPTNPFEPPKERKPDLQIVQAAIQQFRNGQPIDKRCPSCNTVLRISGRPTKAPFSAWIIECDCGLYDDTMRGL